MILTKIDKTMFASALLMAEKSNNTKARMAAVIAYKGDALALSANSGTKSHPLQMKYNRFRGGDFTRHMLHAEIAALAKVAHTDLPKLKDATIYIVRIRLDGTEGMARPCPACMAALVDFGIRKAYYTTDKGFAKEFIL